MPFEQFGTKESQGESEEELCREFLKGKCHRKICKYKHDESIRDKDKEVCKDYQSMQCHRTKCKFLHLSKEEEEQFRSTGVLPERKAIKQIGPEMCRDFKKGFCNLGDSCKYFHPTVDARCAVEDLLAPSLQDRKIPPTCKDYRRSRCTRGDKCKFLHMTKFQEEQYRTTGVLPKKKPVEPIDLRSPTTGFSCVGEGSKYSHQTEKVSSAVLDLLGKRPSSDVSDSLYGKRPTNTSNYVWVGNNDPLEKENAALKQEVFELRLQQENTALKQEALELRQDILQLEHLLGMQGSSSNNVGDYQMTNGPSSFSNNYAQNGNSL